MTTGQENMAKVMQSALWLHDVYYFFIQRTFSPICRVIPRQVLGYTVFSANSVTYARTFLVFVIAACMKFRFNGWASFLVMFHDFLDHIDGVVAKVQRADGRAAKDDGVWGAFIDAFCDKIVFCTCLWTILILLQYQHMSIWVSLAVAVPSFVLMAIELAIGVVRVSDYFHMTLVSDPNGKTRAVRAVMEGKLKQKLESIGVALLAWILPVPSEFPITCGFAVLSLIGAIYMGNKSLLHKLHKWNIAAPE